MLVFLFCSVVADTNVSDIVGYGEEKAINGDEKSISQDDQNSREISTTMQKSKDESKEEIQKIRNTEVNSNEKHSVERTEPFNKKIKQEQKFAVDVTDASPKGLIARQYYMPYATGIMNYLRMPPHFLSNLSQANCMVTRPLLTTEETGSWLFRSLNEEAQGYISAASSSKHGFIGMPDSSLSFQHRTIPQVGPFPKESLLLGILVAFKRHFQHPKLFNHILNLIEIAL